VAPRSRRTSGLDSSDEHASAPEPPRYAPSDEARSVSWFPSSNSPSTPREEPTQGISTPASLPEDPTRIDHQEGEEINLSLFALAQVALEEDNKAFIGNTYVVQAGISQQKPHNSDEESFQLTVSPQTKSLSFDVLVHESENIELSTEWHKLLRYDPENEEPQFVDFTFQVIAPGQSSLDIDFYYERRWLRTTRIQFEAVEKPQLIAPSLEG